MAFGDDGSENLSDIFFPSLFPPFFPLGYLFLTMHFENFHIIQPGSQEVLLPSEEGAGVGRNGFGGK